MIILFLKHKNYNIYFNKGSVTIALITTRELSLKDFAMEPDEKKVLKGTHLIV